MLLSLVLLSVLGYCLQTANARCDCMNKIILLIDEDDFRIVSSPDYPRYYCPSLECTWRVMGPFNQSTVYFHADNLDLREGKDRIEFYEEQLLLDGDEGNMTYSCTGKETCSYTTPTGMLTIKFVTGEGETNNFGFQGTVAAHNRRMREFRLAVTKYFLPVSIALLIILGICIFAICYRRRITNRSRRMEDLGPEAIPQRERLLQ